MSGQVDHEVVVIGCGIGGVAIGYYLNRAGIDDYVILEKRERLGGTWQANTYPGVACDIPSIVYQYSFAYNAEWSRVFAPGHEIQEYTESVADRFRITEHVHCGMDVVKQVWDDVGDVWVLTLADGSLLRARFVIASLGPFVRPKNVGEALPGIGSFKGTLLETANWDHSFDLAGKRVGVVGTGASGVQLSASIADTVSHLSVFQRTAGWVAPKIDFTVPSILRAVQRIPGVIASIRGSLLAVGHVLTLIVFSHWFDKPLRLIMRYGGPLSIKVYGWYIGLVVRDRDTAKRLVPPHGIGTQRPTLSANYHRMFNQSNVSLVTSSIASVEPEGVRTEDGVLHRLDALVTAIGWESSGCPTTYKRGEVIGQDGVDLGEFFDSSGAQAYEGVAVPGFPNRWIMVGPNSWQGNGGWHALVELGAKHAVRAISLARKRRATRIEVRKDVHDRQHRLVRRKAARIEYYFNEVYPKASRSWIINAQREFAIAKPFSVGRNYWMASHFPANDYRYSSARHGIAPTDERTTLAESATPHASVNS